MIVLGVMLLTAAADSEILAALPSEFAMARPTAVIITIKANATSVSLAFILSIPLCSSPALHQRGPNLNIAQAPQAPKWRLNRVQN
jgi:hypothetical protein